MTTAYIYYIWVACFWGSCLGFSSGKWLDPSNPHSFEPEKAPPPHTIGTHCDLSAFLECEKKLENIKLLKGTLQRQTALVLQAANLMDVSSEDTVVRPIILTLSGEQLSQLQDFVKSGNFDTGTLDAAWSSMLMPGYETKWNWNWPSFMISKESMMWALQVGSVLAVAAMLALKTPIKQVIGVTLLLAFIVSVALRAHRTFQATEARQRHLIFDSASMPAVCRPSNEQNWQEWVSLFFTGEVEQESLCSKYYEKTYSDHVTHVTPIELVFSLVMDITQSISSKSGTNLKEFCDTAFADIPYPFKSVVCAVAKLGTLILIIILCALTVWFCLTRHKSLHVGNQARQQHKSAPQYHIVNHGHLVLGSSEMQGLPLGDAQTMSTKQFLRAQSERCIPCEPAQYNRPRSVSSSGALLAPDIREPEPGKSVKMNAFSEEVEFCDSDNLSESILNATASNKHQKKKVVVAPSTSKIPDLSEHTVPSPDLKDDNLTSSLDSNAHESSVQDTSSCEPMCDHLNLSGASLSPMVSQLSVFLDSLQIEESLDSSMDSSKDLGQTENNKNDKEVLTPMEVELSSFEVVEKIN